MGGIFPRVVSVASSNPIKYRYRRGVEHVYSSDVAQSGRPRVEQKHVSITSITSETGPWGDPRTVAGRAASEIDRAANRVRRANGRVFTFSISLEKPQAGLKSRGDFERDGDAASGR